jgi:hypothetical protein
MRTTLIAPALLLVATLCGSSPAADDDKVQSMAATRVASLLEEIGGSVTKASPKVLVWEVDEHKLLVTIDEKGRTLELAYLITVEGATEEVCNEWNKKIRFFSLSLQAKDELQLHADLFLPEGTTAKGAKAMIERVLPVVDEFRKFLSNGGKIRAPSDRKAKREDSASDGR